MAPNRDLGSEVTRLRGERTQADLGKALHMSRSRVSQLESGRVPWPDVGVFNDLARALEVPVQDLLRAAGADIAEQPDEELAWLASQLNSDGLRVLGVLGRALLSEYRRRPETEGA